MAKIKKFEEIKSWKNARTLTKEIYEVTSSVRSDVTSALKIKSGVLRCRFFRILPKA
jgi:hypothetical protein